MMIVVSRKCRFVVDTLYHMIKKEVQAGIQGWDTPPHWCCAEPGIHQVGLAVVTKNQE
jgi:hypothetical protein